MQLLQSTRDNVCSNLLLSLVKVCEFGTIFLGERRKIQMAPHDSITSDREQWCVGPVQELPQQRSAHESGWKGREALADLPFP